MKLSFLLVVFVIIPFFSIAQKHKQVLPALLQKDWRITHAVDLSDSSVVYDSITGIKTWNMSKIFIYPLDDKHAALVSGAGAEMGEIDSVSATGFIFRIKQPDGNTTVIVYSNIRINKTVITYTARRFNLYNNSQRRVLQYAYAANCVPLKERAKFTVTEIEKLRGNRIDYVFTKIDGDSIKNTIIDIAVVMKGYRIQSTLYADKFGKATGYYPDHYFDTNNSIYLYIKSGDLIESVILEKRFCPAVIKPVLTEAKQEDTDDDNIVIPPASE